MLQHVIEALLAALLALSPVAPAATGTMANLRFDAQDTAEVAALMQDLGYRAELVDTADGPYISSAMEGLNFSVTFYHRAEEGRCGSLLLETGFVLDTTIPYETMNGWNETEFMGRAYLA